MSRDGTTQRSVPGSREGGFTLTELLVSIVVSSIIMLTLTTVVIESQRLAAALVAQVRLNQEAREVLEILLSGGRTASGYIPGLHGRMSDPFGSDLTLELYRVQLAGTASPGLNLQSSSAGSYTVTCLGVEDPLASCLGEEDEVQGEGRVAALSVVTDRSIGGRTREITLQLIEPYLAPKSVHGIFGEVDYMDSYWTVATLMLDGTG